jgi:arginyl-tRNA synthetase
VTPAELTAAITDVVRNAVNSGDISVPMPDEIRVERPRSRSRGDYSTNVALQLARPAGRPPREMAELLAKPLRDISGVASVEVAGPGFLNFRLESAAQGKLVFSIIDQGQAYGRSETLSGQRINLEFVSANPTGPLHIGAARWAAVGDALAKILEAAGASVSREYYFNDAGAQIDSFSWSLLAAAKGKPPPEGGYQGRYLTDIATKVISLAPDIAQLDDASAVEIFRVEGMALMLDEIKSSLARFGVEFDVYRNEIDLRQADLLTAAVDRLREEGHTYQADGALWLRTTEFGDDKDRVLVKTNGNWTYFAADCAYYLDKRSRGFSKIVMILGADHHGYVGRLKAMAACFGDDPDETIEILIGQLVNLIQRGQQIKMSKRAGDLVTLDGLIDTVGTDAGRYALARSNIDSPIDLDVTLLASQTTANPVFYVQYAHARLSALQRHAAEMGIIPGTAREVYAELLTDDTESELLGVLGEFPRVMATAAEFRETHRVARYLEELAGAYHKWYDTCRILPRAEEPLTDLGHARLWLAEAVRVVLRNGLAVLGVSAPERI